MTKPRRTLAYIVFCHIDWFVCVMSGAAGVGWIGILTTLVLILCHLHVAKRPLQEAKLIAIAVLVGAVWESALVRSGLLVYPNGVLWPGTAPYWLLSLWALFAIQFNVLLNWLKSRLWWAALIGSVAGPLSFRGGAALHAVRFPHLLMAMLALAAGWAVLLPSLLTLARRWNGICDVDSRSNRKRAVPPLREL